MTTNVKFWAILVVVLLMLFFSSSGRAGNTSNAKAKKGATKERIERGRYLVMMGGCNDCHTDGFMESEGTLPESQWLTGSTFGFMGPWGTSYPMNLRNMVSRMDEATWMNYVSSYKAMPPMPWWELHMMKKQDLSAIYAFIKSLGPKGEEAPANLPPGVMPTTPYFDFEPKFPTPGK
jgi:mono/diheme cytochrome c family protein